VLNVKKLTIKHFLTTFILALSFAAAPVAAGPSEDAAAAISRGDYTTALRLWRALATLGDVKAQMWLGQIYEDGLSDKIPQDYAEAVKWYRLAANQDDPDCQFFLGECTSWARV
jgi:TPR repeat protein